MSQKLKIIIFVSLSSMIFVSGAIFLSRNVITKKKGDESSKIFDNMRQDIERLKQEKDAILKEKDKLSEDAVTYLNLNTKLQNRQNELIKRLSDAQKIIDTKEADIQRLNRMIKEMEDNLKKEKDNQAELKNELLKDKEEFANQIKVIEAGHLKEKSLYQYNLGVAFIKAGLYQDAKSAFEKSLELNPDNADAHYNLALFYENYQKDSNIAIFHYRKYLELNPQASDKEEVELIIKRLLKTY